MFYLYANRSLDILSIHQQPLKDIKNITRFNLPNHKFIQDIQTRWNSQYYMISLVFEPKNALISYCSDHSKPNHLESNQWKVIERLLKIFKQLDDCTNILSIRGNNLFHHSTHESHLKYLNNLLIVQIY